MRSDVQMSRGCLLERWVPPWCLLGASWVPPRCQGGGAYIILYLDTGKWLDKVYETRLKQLQHV